ncbi:uncharacterized protein LOC108736607 isoform X2 [Agrilus planipennis]|uniref:Uncharacterized protein LOC108736607 isoform X2 n=1 Tax=Agrilus planipennis TaxID=224129 RepID=A0A1W4WL09_AGRPL|nr:uncharacterized protein LOC108736607 isoform X2 [Agrilus planipennis]
MSDAADESDKPVAPVIGLNDQPSEIVHTNEKSDNRINTAVPYSERIRQYYNRRMPVSRSNPRQTANPDVEVIPQKPSKKPEIEEEEGGDDRETVNDPYPGVDDGFFGNGTNNNNNPDVENIPLVPKTPTRTNPPEGEDQPGNNPDNDDGRDEPDIGRPYIPGRHFPTVPEFGPHWPNHPEKPSNFPGIRPDVEGGIPEPLPDINVYQHKKTLAQGMMDLALFSANANQLRYVLESYDRHPYYYPSLVLISLSIIFQVGVGVGLIWNSHYDVKNEGEIHIANRLNNYTVIGIFLITAINVFISAFGVAEISPTP